MSALSSGLYMVFFNHFDSTGTWRTRDWVGSFAVDENSIVQTAGIVRDMVPLGRIELRTEIRLCYGLNNGYYSVEGLSGIVERCFP